MQNKAVQVGEIELQILSAIVTTKIRWPLSELQDNSPENIVDEKFVMFTQEAKLNNHSEGVLALSNMWEKS